MKIELTNNECNQPSKIADRMWLKMVGNEKNDPNGFWAIVNDYRTSDNILHRVIIAENFSTWMRAQTYLEKRVSKIGGKYSVVWVDDYHPIGL